MISLATIRSEFDISPEQEPRIRRIIDAVIDKFETETCRFWKFRSSYTRKIRLESPRTCIWIKHRLADTGALVIQEFNVGETPATVAATKYWFKEPETAAGAYCIERIDDENWKEFIQWTADVGYAEDDVPPDINEMLILTTKFLMRRMEGDRIIQTAVSVGEATTSFQTADLPKVFQRAVDEYRYMTLGVE